MNTIPTTCATRPAANTSAPLPVQGREPMPARTAQGRASLIDPGALEYASWLRLLRRPAP